MTAKVSDSAGLTPLMRQFYAIKEQHPDKILFFRMGDFYEMFGDDAVKAAPILGIALTSRSHGKGGKVPLAGVPYHAGDRYLSKLVEAGLKVVVVEQVEDPKMAKGLVKRDIVEILTPGTAVTDSPDQVTVPRWLAAICDKPQGDRRGIAALDLSTGQFVVDEGNSEEILQQLKLLSPSEILYSADQDKKQLAAQLNSSTPSPTLTEYEEFNFDYRSAERDLNNHFGTSTLEGFGLKDCRLAVSAAGAIFRYLKDNHRDQLSHIRKITRFDKSEQMTLDYSTVRNLELVTSNSGTHENTLFSVVNLCATPAGARRLYSALLRPFKVKARIERRLTGVSELVKNRNFGFSVRQSAKKLSDLEKLAGRLGIGKLTPRQLAAIKDSLVIGQEIITAAGECYSPHLAGLVAAWPDSSELIEQVSRSLAPEPPLTSLKGGIFKPGYSERLDNLNDSIKEARSYIAGLQKVERERTGITTLKVGFNKVFGYYLETTKANLEAVPPEYIRKQTLVNAERFITPELKVKEELIFAAEEKIFKLEAELFDELISLVNSHIGDILLAAEILAEIDLVAALAELAVTKGYCRPEISEDTRLEIEGGRHPVIEAVLPAGSFVANDLDLASDRRRMVILTGPNMSGKSTYLRQIGLIVILAQIGSWVPADKAHIGLVDRVFTRVGALDNLAQGQSTFLVEMVETSNILHNATDKSLVLLDEVGRGTSTFDGLSIAWSAVEHINETNQSRTIFATHYHELTGMASIYDHIENFQVAVKKWADRVVFLHKIIPGGCDDSYGIEVGKLAGLPRETITRAKQILKLLESGKFNQSELGQGIYRERHQPTLFDKQPTETEIKIKNADIDNLTPLEALNLLRKLQEELE